jgi:hypothetical protein
MTNVYGISSNFANSDALFKSINKEINNSTNYSKDGTSGIIQNQLVLDRLLVELEKLDAFARDFGKHINYNIKKEKVLTGDEVYIISNLVNVYHQLSIKMNEVNSFARPNGLDGFLKHQTNNQIDKDLIWLTSYLALFKSYKQNYEYFYKGAKIRRMLKNILKTSQDKNQRAFELVAMVSHSFEKGNLETMRKFIDEYDHFLKEGQSFLTFSSRKNIKWISSSSSYTFIKSKEKLKIKNHVLIDNLVTFLGRVTNAVSGIFGNLIGKVRWRHGHLFDDKKVINTLNKKLKPLDIILEKTPFALTDSFIPGHFGHAAIYLGTEKQLKEYGLWESDIIKPYQEEISNGKVIIEAVRPGVRLTSLEHFMEVDDILIMRANVDPANSEESLNVYKRAFDQLGKEYDFNFDVETTDKIVCSELIFFAFGKINWPTEYVLGRPTISPDNVAELIYYDKTPTTFELNLWSKKKGTIQIVSKEDLGEKIGYVKSHFDSKKGKDVFNKKSVICKTVTKRNIRVGSRRSRFLKVRVCRDKLERKVYQYSQHVREKLYGNQQNVSGY